MVHTGGTAASIAACWFSKTCYDAVLLQVVDRSIPWMPRVEVIDAKRCVCRQMQIAMRLHASLAELSGTACAAVLFCQAMPCSKLFTICQFAERGLRQHSLHMSYVMLTLHALPCMHAQLFLKQAQGSRDSYPRASAVSSNNPSYQVFC